MSDGYGMDNEKLVRVEIGTGIEAFVMGCSSDDMD